MPSKVAVNSATNPANHSTKISPSAEILASPTQAKNTNGHSTSGSRSKSIVPSVNSPLVAATTISSSAATSNSKSTNNTTGSNVSRHLWKDQPTIGRYKLTRTLGRGNFAKVKLGEHLLTGQQVAIKVIDKTQLNDNSLKKMVREVRIMKMLNHPNIVRLYEVIESERRVYLVMEYASNGEVFDYLVLNGRMKEKEARVKFRQLISAVEYCHRKNIVHRDLKAENLLLDKDYNIKLADFGFSNFYDDSHKLDTYCGSPPYAAPELFQGQKYTGPEVDVWSLGVILYTLVSGTLPFDAPNLKELQSRVIRGKYRVPFYMSTECEQLLRKLLVLSPSKRKPLNTIMNDKWLNLGFDQSILEQYLEPPPDYHDPVRLSIMQKMGYPPDEVREALRNQTFNNLTAIYLLLGNKENTSATASSPHSAAAGDDLAPPGTSSSNATTTSLSETSTSAGGDEEDNTSSVISGAASREGQQNASRKSDTSGKPKEAPVVEQPARKSTGETSDATVGGGNVELKKPLTYSWMKHSSSAGPPPCNDTTALPVSDGPTLVLPRIHLPNSQWPVGKTGQSEQPPSSSEVHPSLTGAGTCASGEEAKKSLSVGRSTTSSKLRPTGSDAATCLPGLPTSANQPLSRAAQFSDIPNLVTTRSPSPKISKDRSSTLEEEDEPLVDGASLDAGIGSHHSETRPTGDPTSPRSTTPFITKPAVVYRKPNAFVRWLQRIFSCHRRQEPRSASFAQNPPDANALIVRIDSNSQQRVGTSEEKGALVGRPGRHVVDILSPESRHQFTRNCPDRATVLGLTPARLRRHPQSKPRGEPSSSGGDNNSAFSSTAAAATTSSGTQSQADTLYGSVTGGPNPTGSDGTLNSGIVPQLPPTDPPPAPSVASKLQWSMRFRPGKDVHPEEKQEQLLQAGGSPLAKHNSSGDLTAAPTSPAQWTGGRFFRRLTMRLYRSMRRNRSCNSQHKSPTSKANNEEEAQPLVSEAQTETAAVTAEEVTEGVQALASDPWTAMLPGRLQLQCAMPTTFSVYKLSNSSGGSGSNRGSTGQERSDTRQAQPDVKTETGVHGTQPEKAVSQGLTFTSSVSASPSAKLQHRTVKPKRLPLVHRLPIVGRSPQTLAEKVGTVLDSFNISHTVTPTSPFCFTCSTTVTSKQLDELNQLSACVGVGDDDGPDDDAGLAKGDWEGRAPRHKSLSVDLVGAKSPRFLKWEMEIFQLMGPAPRYGIRFKRICGSREAYRILGQKIIQKFI